MKYETGLKRNNNGIDEKIVIEVYEAKYPYRHMVRKVWGIPIVRDSREYNEIKDKLGDHWDSDLTDTWFLPGNFTYSEMEKITELLSS